MGEFLYDIHQEETKIRECLSTPKPLLMTAEDWRKHKNATKCHVCDKNLARDFFLDSMPVFDHNTGSYCGQSHKICFYHALKEIGFFGPKNERQKKDKKGQWIEKNQENCLFCAEPLMKQNHEDSVKDHCHITGKYCRRLTTLYAKPSTEGRLTWDSHFLRVNPAGIRPRR